MEKKMTCVVEQNGIRLVIREGVLTRAELCLEDIFAAQPQEEVPEDGEDELDELDELDITELLQLYMELRQEVEEAEEELAEARREQGLPEEEPEE